MSHSSQNTFIHETSFREKEAIKKTWWISNNQLEMPSIKIMLTEVESQRVYLTLDIT